MNVISLYQPYATLVMLGLKTVETRAWDTLYRGPLGIHASAIMPAWCRNLCLQDPFRRRLRAHQLHAGSLPKGKILGTVDLVGTQCSEDWLDEKGVDVDNFARWYEEYQYGDFSDQRFVWHLRDPTLFSVPILAEGASGLWNYEVSDYV